MLNVLLKEQNLLFIHEPKTAGGSISRVLRKRADAVVYGVEEMEEAIPCVQQLIPRLPKPLSSYRTVAFLRDPLDWAISGYLHVTRNKPAFSSPPSLREFIYFRVLSH